MKRFNLKVTIGLMAVMTIAVFNLRYAHEGYGNAVNKVAGQGPWGTLTGGTGDTYIKLDRYNIKRYSTPSQCKGSSKSYYITVDGVQIPVKIEFFNIKGVLTETWISDLYQQYHDDTDESVSYYAVMLSNFIAYESENGPYLFVKDNCNSDCNNPDYCNNMFLL